MVVSQQYTLKKGEPTLYTKAKISILKASLRREVAAAPAIRLETLFSVQTGASLAFASYKNQVMHT